MHLSEFKAISNLWQNSWTAMGMMSDMIQKFTTLIALGMTFDIGYNCGVLADLEVGDRNSKPMHHTDKGWDSPNMVQWTPRHWKYEFEFDNFVMTGKEESNKATPI